MNSQDFNLQLVDTAGQVSYVFDLVSATTTTNPLDFHI